MTLADNTAVRLALVFCMFPVGTPAVVASPEQGETPSNGQTPAIRADDAREQLVAHLVERGTPEPQAKVIVDTLTDEDVRVLSENPKMLSPAGNSTLIAWAILLAVLIGGATAIIVANTT